MQNIQANIEFFCFYNEHKKTSNRKAPMFIMSFKNFPTTIKPCSSNLVIAGKQNKELSNINRSLFVVLLAFILFNDLYEIQCKK